MDIFFEDGLKLQGPNAFQVMIKPAGPGCNLNCSYCYYLEKKKLYPAGGEYRMTEEMLEDFTRQFIEAQQVPEVTFTWQGGEPTLLGIDFFRKALAFQKKFCGGKKVGNAFQTNGTRLNDEWCRFFHDHHILVGISLDGPEHIHDHYRKNHSGEGSFKKVMKGIELLHRHRVDFNTLSCVHDYGARFGLEIYRFLKQTGSGYMQFLPIAERKALHPDAGELTLVTNDYLGETMVTDWSVGARDYGKFLIAVFDDWIRHDVAKYFVQIFDATLAGWVGEMPGICVFNETCGNSLALEHNGDLYSCDHFVYPGKLLGNILDKPLLEMVKSKSQFDFGLDKRNKLPSFCIRCEFRFACHGECPKHRFIKSPEGEMGLNYLCEGYRMFFKHVFPYMDFMAGELKNKRAPANVMNWIKKRENQAVKPDTPERNDPCPCGSGRKFKYCCMGKPI